MRRLFPVVLLAALAGCAGGQRGACGAAEAVVENASSLAVEQLYLTSATGADWGSDLLKQSPALPAAGRMPLAFGGPGPWRLRLVWVNGRAIELGGIDGCRTRRIILRDDMLTAN